ncbi:MAG: hypothetical protein BWK80_57145 [Desulfobacteraceae bacterium IS3]|nr:MAG: hypothetical protein BWK80_57145 [Desulfobacteraceae bacterium IS3]
MKRYNAIISLPLFFCLMISIETRAAEQFFIEGAFNNSYFPTSMPNAISINTGGNAGQYPDGAGQVPNIGDIKLQRSVFGSIVDGKLAYPNVINELLSEADSLMKSGAKYKTPTAFGGVGQTGIGSGAWDIRFPGVREMDSGKLLQIGDQDQNYFEENILVAAERYRAILQIDPYNSEAAKGLLQTYYERMVPQIFAGNTSNVWAFRNRVTEEQIWQTSTLLEEGLNFYKKAVDIFVELTQTLPDVKYLDGKAGNFNHDTLRIPDAGDNMAIAPKLLETYIRAVSYQAEVTANKVARWYLDDYEYPVFPFENSSKRKQIVDYINKQTSLIQNELVLANVFFGVFSVSNPIEVTDIGRVTQVIGDLLSSRDFIRDGYLSFAVSRNSAGAVTGESYGVYSPEFVPFLYRDPEGLVQFPNSYQNLYSRAKEIVERAITWEKDTRYEDRTFDSNQYELQNRLENIQSEYFSELTQLCGQIRDGEGNLVPDIVLALFPNEERLKKYSYKLAGETASGAIYNQWMTAEMEVDAAMLDLESLVKEMAKKEEIAREIANGVENIAILYLENGEKLAALELQRGELLAQQTEYEDRKRSNLTGSILGIAASAAMAFARRYKFSSTDRSRIRYGYSRHWTSILWYVHS